MSEISEIQASILGLNKARFAELKYWLDEFESERRWEEWDQQIEDDADAGKLDFLVTEALEADANGKLAEF